MVNGTYQHLVTIAPEEKDYATENMLQWFVSEQVEKKNRTKILAALNLVGIKTCYLYVDKELGKPKTKKALSNRVKNKRKNKNYLVLFANIKGQSTS